MVRVMWHVESPAVWTGLDWSVRTYLPIAAQTWLMQAGKVSRLEETIYLSGHQETSQVLEKSPFVLCCVVDARDLHTESDFSGWPRL